MIVGLGFLSLALALVLSAYIGLKSNKWPQWVTNLTWATTIVSATLLTIVAGMEIFGVEEFILLRIWKV